MTVLEKAVDNLAQALETLETRLEGLLDDQSARHDAAAAARAQAQAARKHTAEAGQGVTAAIADIKSLLDNDNAAPKG